MEPHVVDCTKVLVLKLREFATSRRVINLQVWFQYFAFDTIALITVRTLLFDEEDEALTCRPSLIVVSDFSIQVRTMVG